MEIKQELSTNQDSTKYNNLSAIISQSGRTLILINESTGNTIAEINVHGFLKRAFDMASRSNGTYIYYGEVFQLAGYEFIDRVNEVIRERYNG